MSVIVDFLLLIEDFPLRGDDLEYTPVFRRFFWSVLQSLMNFLLLVPNLLNNSGHSH